MKSQKGVGGEMFLRKSLLGISGIILACGMAAFAQEAQPQTPATQDDTFRKDRIERMEQHRERLGRREGMKGREGTGRRVRGMGHLMRELNLSDEQRQQSRAIMQRRLESTKTQREELFKLREKRIAGTFTAEDEARARALHQEIRTAMEGVRTEMAGVLTAEQKARLEELKKERKERMQQRMKERQERLNNKPQ
jgi:protein CpxP